MEVIFLGTSCMWPTKERNHPGVILVRNGEGFLFDCGEGTQRQLRVAGLKPTLVSAVFITHWHGDHVLGLPGLMQTLSASGYEKKLKIFGPKGTKKFVSMMLKTFTSKDMIDFEVKEVNLGICMEGVDFVIESDEMQHGVPCVGYSFNEKNWRKVDMVKIKRLGIPEGPLVGKLQKGEKIVYNGMSVDSEEVTKLVVGRKFVYTADTRPCSGLLRISRNADVVVMEATYSSDMEEKAKEYMHMTAKEAGMAASQAQAKKLVITHFSARYKNAHDLEEDARDVFDNTQAAYDMMRIKI